MNLHVDLERVRIAHKTLRAELLAERSTDGHWVGQLASSPVATAAAVAALVVSHRSDAGAALLSSVPNGDHAVVVSAVQGDLSELLVESLHWLAQNQNEDGGWGETPGGPSNIAATMLARSAFGFTCVPARYAGLLDRADNYIAAQDGAAGLRRQFGKDRTLTAPILATCALAGLVPWRQVPTLAYELICLPQRWHRRLRLSVASYAMAAQVAVGMVKFHHDPPHNPLEYRARRWARTHSLAILQHMQPRDGGFADVVPQTAFVVMCLAAVGLQDHPIVQRGVEFLLASVRADASWPIVTNLSTWNTTLALNSLEVGQPVSNRTETLVVHGHHVPGSDSDLADDSQRLPDDKALDWLLAHQQTEVRPSIGARAGGWSWTDAPGALPETDGTSGALLVLARLRQRVSPVKGERVEQAARRGIGWLLGQQNSDGGWSMFARDWGTSPLDRSGADLTAHALQALAAWQRIGDTGQKRGRFLHHHAAGRLQTAAAIKRGVEFLGSEQRDDGSFDALQFGNLHFADQRNPVCGTSRVIAACAELDMLQSELAQRAARWLVATQHVGGGWGPPRTHLETSGSFRYGSSSWRAKDALAQFCTVEETALAVDALFPLADTSQVFAQAVERGLGWLTDAVEQDRHRRSTPIGLHFAGLWYNERLYPLLLAAGALSHAMEHLTAPREAVAPVG
jgi:squalene-hopene/tetraprenyl-beta-curcumene cyclase